MKIAVKIVVSFLIIVFLGGTIVYFSAGYLSKKALENSIGSNSVLLAEETLNKIDLEIYHRVEDINSYTQDLFVVGAVEESNDFYDSLENPLGYAMARDAEWVAVDEKTITPFMRELIDQKASEELREKIQFYEETYGYVVYGEIFATNKYGANVLQTGKTSDYYQADEEWWQKAKEEGTFIGSIGYDNSSGIISLTINNAMYGDDENFIGVIRAVLSLEETIEVMKTIPANPLNVMGAPSRNFHSGRNTMNLELIDLDGRIIYSSKNYEFLGPSNFSYLKDFSEGYMVSDSVMYAYSTSKPFKNLNNLGWQLIITHDNEEIFAPIRDLKQSLLLAILGACALCIFIGVYTSYIISKPLKKLGRVSEEIGKGNFSEKADIKTEDEIGLLADAINQMSSSLRDLDKMKIDFLNITTHELKTPLTVIYAHLDILDELKKNLTKEQKESLQTIRRNTDQLRNLIVNVLEASRIESGKFELENSEFSPTEKIEEARDNLQQLAKNKGIVIKSVIGKSTPKKITSDAQRFEEILNNLVSNGIKFTKEGSITIESSGDANFIIVNVKDTGEGIPKDKIHKLFQNFYQVDSSISRKYGGTGLGLSITKKLIELQGGTIEVDSAKGSGTSFTFRLPINAKKGK